MNPSPRISSLRNPTAHFSSPVCDPELLLTNTLLVSYFYYSVWYPLLKRGLLTSSPCRTPTHPPTPIFKISSSRKLFPDLTNEIIAFFKACISAAPLSCGVGHTLPCKIPSHPQSERSLRSRTLCICPCGYVCVVLVLCGSHPVCFVGSKPSVDIFLNGTEVNWFRREKVSFLPSKKEELDFHLKLIHQGFQEIGLQPFPQMHSLCPR